MVRYRRERRTGGTYFFTVALADRRLTLLVDHVDLLRNAFREVDKQHPFETVAAVALPDHLHVIWSLPAGDSDFSGRWRAIKALFVRALARRRLFTERNSKGEAGVWQRRFWEHAIRDEEDLQRHVDYIHFNPVKHGHAKRVGDWPHSSFHRFVARGVLPQDWAGGAVVNTASKGFGE
jgi:putative transposase